MIDKTPLPAITFNSKELLVKSLVLGHPGHHGLRIVTVSCKEKNMIDGCGVFLGFHSLSQECAYELIFMSLVRGLDSGCVDGGTEPLR